MDDSSPAIKWCSALTIVLLCACSSHNPGHSVSEPTNQTVDRYSAWVPSGYRCKWGPESSGFTADKLIDQYGACGMTRTRTITPVQLDPVTGIVRISGAPYDLMQMDNTRPSSRRIYADFYRKFTPMVRASGAGRNPVTYVGLVPGARKLSVIGGGQVGAFLAGSGDKAIGVLSASDFSSSGQAANWLARYAYADFTNDEGKAIATFAVDFSGRTARGIGPDWRNQSKAGISSRTGAVAYLSPVSGGVGIKAFFSKWKASPGIVSGLRLHNR